MKNIFLFLEKGYNYTCMFILFLMFFLYSLSVPAPIYFNSDDTPDIIIRPNKGKWMHYDYSYLAVADGRTGDILWTFNSSFLAATSPVTILNRKRGYDGMVFLTSGKTREQEGGEDRMSRRGTCARSFVAADRRTCTAQLEKERSKRHEEEEEEGMILCML